MPKKSIIKTDKLCKSFSVGGVQQHIIKNLSTEIYEGDFTVIMGPSGAGKSTLMYALSGMDKASLGKVWFDDRDITKFTSDQLAIFRRRHCGFVFQQVYLMDTMSVMDNVLTAGLLTGQNRRELNKKAQKLLEQVGIGRKLWNKFPNQLSGGEAQRVGIVRAIINSPDMVFADEPTGALDSKTSRDILILLEEINRKYNTTMLIVTHNNSIKNMVHKVIIIKDGLISKDYENEQITPANMLEDL